MADSAPLLPRDERDICDAVAHAAASGEALEIVGGGTLDFEMGPEPNKSWASAAAAAPPSLSHSTNAAPASPAQGEPPR